jgi:deoxyribodipyrimidine photolyase-related protein
LYWRFIDRHRDFFIKNPRMGVMVNSYDKMDADKRNRLSVAAEQFLKQLN